MLFRPQRPQSTQSPAQSRRFHGAGHFHNPPSPAPDRLDLLCKEPGHPLPCRMRFIGLGTSPKGQAYATYACPLCNTREGWVFDRYTSRPVQLWRKPSRH
jgi:hypothetical protein